MDRLRRLPLPALLPIVFVVVGGLYFLLGLLGNPSRIDVLARLLGSLFYALVMTVFFGVMIAIRRRKAGGADAVTAMQRTIRTGDVPAAVDTPTWLRELERYQVRYRRNRWALPVMFGIFAVLCVLLAFSLSPIWWLFLVLFAALGAYAVWETRRALRNLASALTELGHRPVALSDGSVARTSQPTPGASWTLPPPADRAPDAS
ncbi:hypothetical protein [Curtobacterium sp. ISL-83]|uniref:hypothetical protein n=1 Tax=Curtobacterium sp. ISL-83 TaxID=2819145 RepID=UPI001BE6D6E0|nr:hypothetical protein [Curtobacterium sp. ISL-83]MBT2501764.1 hypothetical protein [Curtobacterium sp. ISL-83]